VVEECCRA